MAKKEIDKDKLILSYYLIDLGLTEANLAEALSFLFFLICSIVLNVIQLTVKLGIQDDTIDESGIIMNNAKRFFSSPHFAIAGASNDRRKFGYQRALSPSLIL